MVVVAQLVRALVCGAGSRGFESRLPPLKVSEKSGTFFYLEIFDLISRQYQ